MRRFGDGDLVLDDSAGFGVEIAGLLGPLNGLMQLANTVAIFIIAAQRRVISRDAFQRVTGFQQIELGFRVVGQELDQRVAKALPQAALYKGSTALATKQQALGFEALNRLTERGTGNVELFCQFAFRREFFTGAQRPLKNQKLQLLLYHIRKFWLADLAVGHIPCLCHSPGVNWSYQFKVRSAKVTKYSPPVHTGFD